MIHRNSTAVCGRLLLYLAFFGLAAQLGPVAARAGTEWEDGTTLYVANEGQIDGSGSSLSVIDGARLTVTATVDLGKSGPLFPVVAPDGRSIWVTRYVYNYVTNQCDGSGVTVINAASLRVEASLPLPPCPNTLAFTPDGKFVYVTSSSGPITVIDTARRSVAASIVVATGQGSLAMGRDGKFVYATDATDAHVTVIDTETNMPVRRIAVGGDPQSIAIAPDGHHAFTWVDGPPDIIDEISLRADRVVARIPPQIFTNANGLVVSPDGKLLYDVDYSAQKVWVYSTRERRRTGGIGPLNSPIGIALSPNGDLAYVTDNNCPNFPCTSPGFVSAVDTGTRTITTTVDVGVNPQYVALAPPCDR